MAHFIFLIKTRHYRELTQFEPLNLDLYSSSFDFSKFASDLDLNKSKTLNPNH
jgi:hypothetical protein